MFGNDIDGLVGRLFVLFFAAVGATSMLDLVLHKHFIPSLRGIARSLLRLYPRHNKEQSDVKV